MLGSVCLVVVGVRMDACVFEHRLDPEQFALKVIVSIELESSQNRSQKRSQKRSDNRSRNRSQKRSHNRSQKRSQNSLR